MVKEQPIGSLERYDQAACLEHLAGLVSYASTLLHEIGHMTSGTMDGTLDFESELSHLLGITAAAALAR
jgi:hypothetical protein